MTENPQPPTASTRRPARRKKRHTFSVAAWAELIIKDRFEVQAETPEQAEQIALDQLRARCGPDVNWHDSEAEVLAVDGKPVPKCWELPTEKNGT